MNEWIPFALFGLFTSVSPSAQLASEEVPYTSGID